MGWGCRIGELLLQSAGEGLPGHCGGVRRRLGALHEGGVLLGEGGVHFGLVGSSCSTHNPWPVDPDPRGTGLLEARLKAEPASNHDHRRPAQTSARERCRRSCGGGAGMCRKNLGLAPALPGVHSADITETAAEAPSGNRWNTAVSCQECSPDSGLMSALWTPTPRHASPLSLPRLPDHQPAQGSRPNECLRTHDTQTSQKSEDSTVPLPLDLAA